MSKTLPAPCINPQVGRLLTDALSEVLLEPGREEDRKLFWDDHFVVCQACRGAVLDHVNETVTVPLMRNIARQRGMSLDELRKRLGDLLEKTSGTSR